MNLNVERKVTGEFGKEILSLCIKYEYSLAELAIKLAIGVAELEALMYNEDKIPMHVMVGMIRIMGNSAFAYNHIATVCIERSSGLGTFACGELTHSKLKTICKLIALMPGMSDIDSQRIWAMIESWTPQ